ncbi:hypothetical protein M011DRAFT_476783 [Sporormia fimetaria CBS 119925]|uniref:Uncharacterized protein n=1 Tax=Sporormia fimetaria CBS 119925 TaxID=1340428 RepID=A0A6A6VEG7_9PLEO|nr:hypothetical protein M011DRAFT_476783 [Sporormia fimetaria CBS 119925]
MVHQVEYVVKDRIISQARALFADKGNTFDVVFQRRNAPAGPYSRGGPMEWDARLVAYGNATTSYQPYVDRKTLKSAVGASIYDAFNSLFDILTEPSVLDGAQCS